MNKKGFAATGILYTILVLFILLFSGMLTILYSRNNILIKIQNQVKDNVEDSVITYDVYQNGTPVYFNPVTGNLCDEGDAVSTTGTKTGCMKWYIFNDNITNGYVNMILDHNTTATVAWNSEGTNTVMKEVATALSNDTSTWKDELAARLITADELAMITQHPTFNVLTTTDWFFFDSNNQTQTATAQGMSDYSWLFDYTYSCTNYGCNIADSSTYGYWTSSTVASSSTNIWYVNRGGNLMYVDNVTVSNHGIRPVITIDKGILKQQKYVMTNIFENGSFENGFTGWNSNLYGKGGGTSSIAYSSTGVNSVYINAIDANEKAIQYVNSEITLKANHLYYFAMEGYVTSYTSGPSTFGSLVNSAKHIGFEPAILNKWQRLSDVITTTNDSTNVDIRFGQVFAFDCVYQAYMDDIMLIDLTEAFESGNEPTKEWCDQNIDWFEGSKNIYK